MQTSLIKTSFTRKFVTSLMTGLTIVAFLLFLGNGGDIPWLPAEIIFPLSGITLLTAVSFPFIWHYLERKKTFDAVKTYGIFYGIIRYCLAFNIMGFGWKKIFGLQFIVPQEISSLPMNRQTGEWLTWYYFGYSDGFGLIIAAIQITAAVMLLFNRTLLSGAVILFAVMANLMLINICYDMNAGAVVQSVVLTLALSFILLSDYRRLIDFFLKQKTNLPALSATSVVKAVLRISVVIVSLAFTVYLKSLVK